MHKCIYCFFFRRDCSFSPSEAVVTCILTTTYEHRTTSFMPYACIWCYSLYAIVNDRLSALELAITPGVGHDGWANDVTLSNIHERSLFTSRFQLFQDHRSNHGNTIRMHLRPTPKLGYLSYKTQYLYVNGKHYSGTIQVSNRKYKM